MLDIECGGDTPPAQRVLWSASSVRFGRTTRRESGTMGAVLRLLFAALALFASEASGGHRSTRTVDDAFELSSSRTQQLEFIEDDEFGLLFTEIELDASTQFSLQLERHSLRADDFQLLLADGSGQLTPVAPPPVTTYHGFVVGQPQFTVHGSYQNGQLHAVIVGPNDSWTVQPIGDAISSSLSSLHVVYHHTQLLPTAGECGVANHVAPTFAPGPVSAGSLTEFKVCEVGLEADYDYYASFNFNLAQTVGDLEDILNSVESVYEEPNLLIQYEVTTIVVRTSDAPYTTSSPSSLLGQFDQAWSTSPESGIHRDIAHLFTGRNLSGSVIGIARLSSICSSSQGYGLSQSRYTSNYSRRVSLTAHELGHNWSAQHCNSHPPCRIMCSSNGGCNGLSPLTFADWPSDYISSYRDTRPCLTTLPESIPLPFEDLIPSLALDGYNWIYNRGVQISTSAIGEPSGEYAFRLNAQGSGDFDDDEIRSGFIMLAGSQNPTLEYFVEQRGVPAGGKLYVEYWATGDLWVVLNELTSDGVDQDAFVNYSHLLPSNAKHDEFRVRFRPDVDGTSDNWYVDSISVSEGSPPPGDPPTITQVTPLTGPITGGTTVTIHGSDFHPESTIVFGVEPLLDVVYVNGTEIQGTTPPSLTTGFTDVTITQESGEFTAAGAFLYTNNELAISEEQALPDATVTVHALATHEIDLSGYSLAATFDSEWIEVVNLDLIGSDAESADFFAPNFSNALGDAWWTVGVVFDLSPPLDSVLSAGVNQNIANVHYHVDAAAPDGTIVAITPSDGAGDPPVSIVFSIPGGTSTMPTLDPGFVEVVTALFVRGDGNLDGSVDVADAVSNLAYQFDSGPAPCLDAFDTNDDGTINIADPVFCLDFLFTSGPPPYPPYPDPGPDLTADTLDCATSP